MKTVYSSSTISIVSIFQNILEGHGISCWIKNEFISAGIGQIPPIECWPQLCVDDGDFSEAERIVAEALAVKESAAWKCDSCGEEIEGQFTECWKCGSSRPPTG
jgi:lambda repressor-like predicted transcriptional regulator